MSDFPSKEQLVTILYFANPTRLIMPHIKARRIGYIDTPAQGNKRPRNVLWCADNGAFSNKFDEKSWWVWLCKHSDQSAYCMFAVAPDVMQDAEATLARSRPWFSRIRELGYPVAFVAQDGQENLSVPWDEFDALFIGGSNEFKLGPGAAQLACEAKEHGKYLHMGRVNSYRRLAYANRIAGDLGGCDSADGTFITYGPEINVPRLLSWLEKLRDET
jgi:hypothetical protein